MKHEMATVTYFQLAACIAKYVLGFQILGKLNPLRMQVTSGNILDILEVINNLFNCYPFSSVGVNSSLHDL